MDPDLPDVDGDSLAADADRRNQLVYNRALSPGSDATLSRCGGRARETWCPRGGCAGARSLTGPRRRCSIGRAPCHGPPVAVLGTLNL
jgi:hypothetical protein